MSESRIKHIATSDGKGFRTTVDLRGAPMFADVGIGRLITKAVVIFLVMMVVIAMSWGLLILAYALLPASIHPLIPVFVAILVSSLVTALIAWMVAERLIRKHEARHHRPSH